MYILNLKSFSILKTRFVLEIKGLFDYYSYFLNFFKDKCEKYWIEEEESLTFGEISIATKSITTFSDYVVRTFVIKQVIDIFNIIIKVH